MKEDESDANSILHTQQYEQKEAQPTESILPKELISTSCIIKEIQILKCTMYYYNFLTDHISNLHILRIVNHLNKFNFQRQFESSENDSLLIILNMQISRTTFIDDVLDQFYFLKYLLYFLKMCLIFVASYASQQCKSCQKMCWLDHFFLQKSILWCTYYRHTMAKSLILCGPILNPNPKEIYIQDVDICANKDLG